MTILEALQRAKLLGKEKAANASASAHRENEAEPTPTKRRVRVQTEFDKEAAAPLQFKELKPNPGMCEQNRVLLVSDSSSGRRSPVSNAYRMLRTRLWQRIRTERWSSLAVTSSGPGEGKSVTVLNLASAMAMDNKRNIFVLDLDLRRPSLCRYLGIAPEAEIGDFLLGNAKAEEIFFSIGIPKLIVAGGLNSYDGSSEMLGGERLAQLLEYIAQVDPNAITLVDLPPLLSTADALVVAPKLSATLLVVADGKTRRDGLERAIGLLGGVAVAGILLNHSRESIGSYYD